MSDQFGNYIPGLESALKTISTYDGEGSPVGVVTPTADVAVYRDSLNGDSWEWRGASWTKITVTGGSVPSRPNVISPIPSDWDADFSGNNISASLLTSNFPAGKTAWAVRARGPISSPGAWIAHVFSAFESSASAFKSWAPDDAEVQAAWVTNGVVGTYSESKEIAK